MALILSNASRTRLKCLSSCHHDVELPQLVGDAPHHSLDLPRVRDVGDHGKRAPPGPAYRLSHLLKLVPVLLSVVDRDVQPSAARRSAIPRPMPLAAPVAGATLDAPLPAITMLPRFLNASGFGTRRRDRASLLEVEEPGAERVVLAMGLTGVKRILDHTLVSSRLAKANPS